MKRWQKIGLAVAAIVVPALSCGQRSLVLLDVKASANFDNPTELLDVGMSVTANDQITTRFSNIRLSTADPYQIGMYLPSDMSGTVTFFASVDNGMCKLGTGMATATGVQSGETTQAIELIIMPTSGCVPIDGGAGTTGTAGAGGTTGTAGAGGTTGTAGAGDTGGTTTGHGGTTGTAGMGGVTGTAGRGGTTGTAGMGGVTGTAGRGGTTGTAGVGGAGGMMGMAGRGGTTGTAGIGGTVGTAGIGGRGGTAGVGGIGGVTGGGGAGGITGVGGAGGITGVGGAGGTFSTTGAGGAISTGGAGGGPGCGATTCLPPYVCNGSGVCVCSETDAQACARAGIPCGYVLNNCGAQVFCACKIVGTICDPDLMRCMAGCVTGTGGIITADIICPVSQ